MSAAPSGAAETAAGTDALTFPEAPPPPAHQPVTMRDLLERIGPIADILEVVEIRSRHLDWDLAQSARDMEALSAGEIGKVSDQTRRILAEELSDRLQAAGHTPTGGNPVPDPMAPVVPTGAAAFEPSGLKLPTLKLPLGDGSLRFSGWADAPGGQPRLNAIKATWTLGF